MPPRRALEEPGDADGQQRPRGRPARRGRTAAGRSPAGRSGPGSRAAAGRSTGHADEARADQRDRPTPKIVSARPVATWLASSDSVSTPKISAISAPASAPATMPSQRCRWSTRDGEGGDRARQHHALDAEVEHAGASRPPARRAPRSSSGVAALIMVTRIRTVGIEAHAAGDLRRALATKRDAVAW